MPKQPHIEWLQKVRQFLVEALRNGETLAEFRVRFDALALNRCQRLMELIPTPIQGASSSR